MNQVILSGRFTKDPEVRYSQGSEPMAVARFTLAVDRKIKQEGGQNADFIQCVAFRKTAEFIEKYLHKGSKVIVSGRWQTGSYQNKDGVTVYTNDCMVDSIEFAETKAAQAQEQETPAQGTDFMSIPEGLVDELPFN